eukprot:3627739-Pyramimonas_sp.AAC.2
MISLSPPRFWKYDCVHPAVVRQRFHTPALAWNWIAELNEQEGQQYPLAGCSAMVLGDRPQSCEENGKGTFIQAAPGTCGQPELDVEVSKSVVTR